MNKVRTKEGKYWPKIQVVTIPYSLPNWSWGMYTIRLCILMVDWTFQCKRNTNRSIVAHNWYAPYCNKKQHAFLLRVFGQIWWSEISGTGSQSGSLQAIHGTTRLPTQFTAQLAPHFKQLLFPASAEIQANFQQTSYVELSFLGVSTSFLL